MTKKMSRWWYHPPKQRSRPLSFVFDVYRNGGDEYCNPTVYIGLPLLGAWVIRYKWGPIRTEACTECQREQGPWCAGCESCHRGPRCHDLITCYDNVVHNLAQRNCPTCGGWYCPDCEDDPVEVCPNRRETS